MLPEVASLKGHLIPPGIVLWVLGQEGLKLHVGNLSLGFLYVCCFVYGDCGNPFSTCCIIILMWGGGAFHRTEVVIEHYFFGNLGAGTEVIYRSRDGHRLYIQVQSGTAAFR